MIKFILLVFILINTCSIKERQCTIKKNQEKIIELLTKKRVSL